MLCWFIGALKETVYKLFSAENLQYGENAAETVRPYDGLELRSRKPDKSDIIGKCGL